MAVVLAQVRLHFLCALGSGSSEKGSLELRAHFLLTQPAAKPLCSGAATAKSAAGATGVNFRKGTRRVKEGGALSLVPALALLHAAALSLGGQPRVAAAPGAQASKLRGQAKQQQQQHQQQCLFMVPLSEASRQLAPLFSCAPSQPAGVGLLAHACLAAQGIFICCSSWSSGCLRRPFSWGHLCITALSAWANQKCAARTRCFFEAL